LAACVQQSPLRPLVTAHGTSAGTNVAPQAAMYSCLRPCLMVEDTPGSASLSKGTAAATAAACAKSAASPFIAVARSDTASAAAVVRPMLRCCCSCWLRYRRCWRLLLLQCSDCNCSCTCSNTQLRLHANQLQGACRHAESRWWHTNQV
jgi:hypothetical protein